MCASGFRISTPEGRSMSPAVTSPGPLATSGTSISAASECIRATISLRLRTMSVTSSFTPEMVENSCAALDPNARHGGAGERAQQHPPERVAERVAEASVERLDRKRASIVLDLLGRNLGGLELEHGIPSCREPATGRPA